MSWLVEMTIEKPGHSSKGHRIIRQGFYFRGKDNASTFSKLLKKATGYRGDKIIVAEPQEV